MKFNEEYTRYWSSAVEKSIDGTVIAGANEARYFLNRLGLRREDRALDLGCSFGRMHEALAAYCDQVFGIDPDPYAVDKARSRPYAEVHQGIAENTGFDRDFFNLVFCWAVFDVVDHKKSLAEINRILKTSGKLLFTGKNGDYHPDDDLAFKAEKNAFLKGFPNRFTDLSALVGSFKKFGFELDRLFIFPRRGDFGLLNFVEQSGSQGNVYLGYDYLVFCHKIADVEIHDLPGESVENRFSKTAIAMSDRAGFSGPETFFASIGFD